MIARERASATPASVAAWHLAHAVIVAAADDHVAAQQAGGLAGRGAVERLVELELERSRPRRATRQGTAREW